MNNKEFVKLLFIAVVVFILGIVVALNPASNLKYLYDGIVTSSKTDTRIQEEVLSLQSAFISVAEKIKPAVVNISTVYLERIEHPYYEFFFGSPFEDFFEEFFDRPSRRRSRRLPPSIRRHEGTGSGVIISEDGYILTNEHVIRNADEIQVTVYESEHSQKKYKGRVVGRDVRTDLAVIKIESNKKFPFARLGDSDTIKVGQWVIAIGSPFGLEQTVTTGIVSAKRQSLSIEGRTYRDLIQTDAAINRGNSGGPLCNINGEVIGINTAIYAPTGVFSGVGFAVPINRAKAILDEMIKTGGVTRGWLGVELRAVDLAIEKNFNLPDRNGAFVNNVLDDSPAKKAGINRGDVIVEFEGKKVHSPLDLQDLVSATPPGKSVRLKVIRDGKPITLMATLGQSPDSAPVSKRTSSKEPIEDTYTWEGAVVSNITSELQDEYNLSADLVGNGVLVVSVEDNSKSEVIGFVPGDVIKAINRKPVSSVDEFRRIVRKQDFSKGIVFDIIRNGRSIFITYSEE